MVFTCRQMTSLERQWGEMKVTEMGQGCKYLVVEAGVLPEIFTKVVEAKRLLQTGEVRTVNEAARKVGISRSAFYKYKDTVRPFNDVLSGRIVTLRLTLKDEPGVLSKVLNIIASLGGNVLTINQSIPSGGVAGVSIGAETSGLRVTMEELLGKASGVSGVLHCETLAGQ